MNEIYSYKIIIYHDFSIIFKTSYRPCACLSQRWWAPPPPRPMTRRWLAGGRWTPWPGGSLTSPSGSWCLSLIKRTASIFTRWAWQGALSGQYKAGAVVSNQSHLQMQRVKLGEYWVPVGRHQSPVSPIISILEEGYIILTTKISRGLQLEVFGPHSLWKAWRHFCVPNWVTNGKW